MSQIHQLEQGTPEWHAFRAKHFGASEASAMLGLSPYMSRVDLLKQKATGITPDVSPAQQAIFNRGHEAEIGGRKQAEELIGQELYPAIYSDGKLSVSCDGLTMLSDVCFEHKLYNAELAESVRNDVLPTHHQPQCQQAMMVTGAERLLFMTSDGTPDNMAWMWVHPDRRWRTEILQGWAQFAVDIENYQHTEAKPEAVAAPIEALPALMIQVEGRVVATNLDVFKAKASAFIANIKTELVNDQDFADADKMVKFLGDGEKQLELVKAQAQAQASSIDEVFRAIDAVKDQMRTKRLALEKLVKAEKENRKYEILNDAQTVFQDHLNKLEERIGGGFLPGDLIRAAGFPDAIKGLKSLDSMRDKLDAALAKAKVNANEIADRIEANKKIIDAVDDACAGLFADLRILLLKDTDDLKAIVASRIADHKAAVEKRAQEELLDAATKAQVQQINTPPEREAGTIAEARPEPAAPAYAVCDQHTPEQAVIDAEDDIRAFLEAKVPASKRNAARAVLVEWIKWNAELVNASLEPAA